MVDSGGVIRRAARAYHGAQKVAAGAEAKVLTRQAVQLPPATLALPAVHCRGGGSGGANWAGERVQPPSVVCTAGGDLGTVPELALHSLSKRIQPQQNPRKS